MTKERLIEILRKAGVFGALVDEEVEYVFLNGTFDLDILIREIDRTE